MGVDKNQKELLKQNFKTWVNILLFNKNMSKKELAERIDVPFSRISEAINGTGDCTKYIKQIILELGDENDLQRFRALYN